MIKHKQFKQAYKNSEYPHNILVDECNKWLQSMQITDDKILFLDFQIHGMYGPSRGGGDTDYGFMMVLDVFYSEDKNISLSITNVDNGL